VFQSRKCRKCRKECCESGPDRSRTSDATRTPLPSVDTSVAGALSTYGGNASSAVLIIREPVLRCITKGAKQSGKQEPKAASTPHQRPRHALPSAIQRLRLPEASNGIPNTAQAHRHSTSGAGERSSHDHGAKM
jgi:hypothetical protein